VKPGRKTRGPAVTDARIVVSKDGPYLVSGGLPLRKERSKVGRSGEPEWWVKGERYSVGKQYGLCRCGRSKTAPFCDGTHSRVGFDGTERASRKTYAQLAERTEGPTLDLDDVEALCSSARFCMAGQGTWDLTEGSDHPGKRKKAVRQAGNCPSGRLVVYDKKTGKPIEPEFEPSLSVTEHPQKGVSGPVWVKGGVPIVSADGSVYEIRNRVTLCRCGQSRNKPFCDGSHITARFTDGDKSLKRRRKHRTGNHQLLVRRCNPGYAVGDSRRTS